ncbi:MAG: ABC transporter ATP-binding protein, partial [Ruminococcaceae bacterium]|nr:ABC transporter ATP-binding protein [Oscillospiraceae bacterium]
MFRKLLRYIRGYEGFAVGAPLCVALEVVCALILPRLMSTIIDQGIDGDGGFPLILRMGAIMLGLSVVSMATGLLSSRLASTASQGFGANLRKALFDKVQDFSFTDIDRFSSASLITRLTNDVNAIQQMVGMGLRMLVRAPLMLLIALVNCASINPRLTLVLLAVVPVMAVSIFLLMKVTRR